MISHHFSPKTGCLYQSSMASAFHQWVTGKFWRGCITTGEISTSAVSVTGSLNAALVNVTRSFRTPGLASAGTGIVIQNDCVPYGPINAFGSGYSGSGTRPGTCPQP